MSRILFHTSSYGYLAQKIFDIFKREHLLNVEGGIHEGRLTIETFPDEEIYHRIDSNIADQDVYIIGGTINDKETLELYDMGCSIMDGVKGKGSAKSLTIIIPYFGYSTAERAVKDGELVKAKLRANMISNIGNIKLFLIDLHAEGIVSYFDRNVHVTHLYTKNIIFDICNEIKTKEKVDSFVIGSTDAGRAKWVESLSKDMGVECAIITKRRISGSETQISGINASVDSKVVIIYDDMVRTGGSLIKAAKAYKDAGASKVYAIATHGVLPGDSLYKLQHSRVLDGLYITDTHKNVEALEVLGITEENKFLKIRSVAGLIIKSVF